VSARNRARRRGGESAGTALEFAMLSPVLLALLFGVFELGWALHCSSTVRHALEATGRTLEMNPSYSEGDLKHDLVARLPEFSESQLAVSYTKTATAGGVSLGEVDVTYSHPLGYPVADLGQLRFRSSVVAPLNGG
jgi:Flp pilus assembly protein TadG